MKPMPQMITEMTAFPHAIDVSRPLSEARAMMYASEVRHLPVVEGTTLIGILSDRDVKLAISVCKNEQEAGNLLVSDACNFEAYVVDVEARLDTVVSEMFSRKIGSALVTKRGKLVGIFTTTDACRKLAELLKIHYPDA